MNFDFNLDNYHLSDLLNLFKLKYNFNIEDLKDAKKMVMQIHPDKSGLDKEYFLFYCKAFRVIKNIYDLRNKPYTSLNSNNSNIEYLAESEEDKGNKLLVENLMKKDNLDFNKWFNETFEKINIVEEERKTGYGDWLKTNEDIDTTTTTLNRMHEKISHKKKLMSSLAKKEDIKELNSSAIYQELDQSAPTSYGADIFSKLPYEDLKIAHTETVVPVCEDDYNKVKKFTNVESLRNYRFSQNTENKPMSYIQANEYNSNKRRLEDENNIKLLYKLSMQDEETKKANKRWWSNLKLLK